MKAELFDGKEKIGEIELPLSAFPPLLGCEERPIIVKVDGVQRAHMLIVQRARYEMKST